MRVVFSDCVNFRSIGMILQGVRVDWYPSVTCKDSCFLCLSIIAVLCMEPYYSVI